MSMLDAVVCDVGAWLSDMNEICADAFTLDEVPVAMLPEKKEGRRKGRRRRLLLILGRCGG